VVILVQFLVPSLELLQVLVGLQHLRTRLVCCVILSLERQLEQSWCHCRSPAVPHQKVLQISRQAPHPTLLETKLEALNGSFSCQDCGHLCKEVCYRNSRKLKREQYADLVMMYNSRSENEWTHFKHFYLENKQSPRGAVFTTWQQNCQSFTYDTCSNKRTSLRTCVTFRAFQYWLDIVQATKVAQVEVQWNGEGGGIFWVTVSWGRNCTLLAPLIF
jgi:rubrerythrin